MLFNFLKNTVVNFRGKPLNKKVVVIESDDWGSIRMASIDSYNKLLKKGLIVNDNPYDKFDSIESNSDLEFLFETLSKVKDCNGQSAIITANNIVANPDFLQIKGSNFSEYFYQPFTDTLSLYPNHNNVLNIYKQGIRDNVILPQFHGREHVCVPRWFKILKKYSLKDQNYFESSIFSLNKNKSNRIEDKYLAAFDFDGIDELEYQTTIIKDGLSLFEKIWGFKSQSFIAPCYIWHPILEKTLIENNVKYIQGLFNQFSPQPNSIQKFKKIYHYQFQKNNYDQNYFVRNAFFEPSINQTYDWESDCLRRIYNAFLLKKPAIISTHRLNFIGFLHPQNRDQNLKRLHALLKRIVKVWPDVEFKNTVQLAELYNNSLLIDNN